MRVGVIGHGGLLREFSFARPICTDKGFWECLGNLPLDMPRRPGDLGFAMQLNAETPWNFAQLRYPRVINSIYPK